MTLTLRPHSALHAQIGEETAEGYKVLSSMEWDRINVMLDEGGDEYGVCMTLEPSSSCFEDNDVFACLTPDEADALAEHLRRMAAIARREEEKYLQEHPDATS